MGAAFEFKTKFSKFQMADQIWLTEIIEISLTDENPTQSESIQIISISDSFQLIQIGNSLSKYESVEIYWLPMKFDWFE